MIVSNPSSVFCLAKRLSRFYAYSVRLGTAEQRQGHEVIFILLRDWLLLDPQYIALELQIE